MGLPRSLCFAVLAAFWAAGAAAQQADPKGAGWYLGGGIRPVVPQVDETDIGYRYFGGYRFSRNWGVELGYSDLGKGDGEPGVLPVQKSAAQTSAWTLAGTGVWPIGEAFSLLGRVGLSVTSPDATALAAGGATGSALPRYRPTVLWGFGGQYDVTGNVGLRVDYNNFGRLADDPNGTRSDLWSVNAVVRF